MTDASESVGYETILIPLQGQSGPAQTYRTMEAGSWPIGGVTYNRRYQYPPGFAGGVDVVAGWWRQRVRKVTDTNINRQADVQLVNGVNSSGDITNNPPYSGGGGGTNQAPIWGSIPNQRLSRKRYWSYQVPVATDPETQPLTYSISGLPSGLSFDASTRTISGTTAVAVNNYLVTVTATDPQGASSGQSFYIQVEISLCNDFRQYTSGDNVGSSSLIYEYNNGSDYPRAFTSTTELVALMGANTSVNFDFVRVTGGNWVIGSRMWGSNNPTIIDNANANPGVAPSPALYNADEAGWWARNPVYSGGSLQSVDMIQTDTCGYIIAIQQYVKGSGAGVVGSKDIFNPSIEWSAGKARVVNTATPSIPSGYALYYWISGGVPSTALPATYDYDPGDQVTIYAAIANTTDPVSGTFYPAYSVILF